MYLNTKMPLLFGTCFEQFSGHNTPRSRHQHYYPIKERHDPTSDQHHIFDDHFGSHVGDLCGHVWVYVNTKSVYELINVS
jgi:hypothetical protein